MAELNLDIVTPLELLDYIQRETRFSIETVFWNTVIWRRAIKSNLPYCPQSPRNVWILHKGSIAGENMHEFHPGEPLWEIVHGVDAIVFVEAALRALWKESEGLVPMFTILGHTKASFTKVHSASNFEQSLARVLGTLSQRKEALSICHIMDTTCGVNK